MSLRGGDPYIGFAARGGDLLDVPNGTESESTIKERLKVDRSSPWFSLGVVLTGTSIGAFNNSVASVALPHVLGSFEGVSVSEGTWLLTLYIFATAALMPFAGRMLDFWGTRKIYGASFLIYAAGSLLCALAPSYTLLILGRVIQGIAGAAVLPTVFTTVRMAFPEGRRGRALGIWAAVNGASLSGGPVIGGLLIGAFGWRSIFWLDVPIALLAAAAMWRWVKDYGGEASGSFDVIGGVLMLFALTGAMVVLGQADRWGLDEPLLWVIAGGTLTTLVVYSRHALRNPTPFFDIRLFKERAYAIVTCVAALQMVALFAVLFAVPLLLQRTTDAPPVLSGALISLTPLVATGTAPLAGRLVDRVGLRIPLTAGTFMLALGGIGLMLATGSGYLWLAISLLTIGLGVGLIQSPAATGVTYAVESAKAGVALGAFNTARFISGVAGASVFAIVFETVTGIGSGGRIEDSSLAEAISGFRAVFIGIVIAGALGMWLATRLPSGHPPRRPGRQDEEMTAEGTL